ncbi:hypothetical protein CP556_22230 [Natrinema sp. CBA1119]|uniref:DUF7344 domain-containing protein n=1 Tax=Natrinema sp. CBA1119 TaxID=1608465 RepID=UPI000BF91203|nr:hypothetical protein [Natrinema sp. CBA1119]PGF13828.1 hypothetical protein CP556_22230 [Natrinema sp. CBA1119]
MVSVDEVLGLLNDERRRYTLYYLKEQNGAVHIDDVVEAVAEMEADTAAGTQSVDDLEDIKLTLYHQHLPKTRPLEFVHFNRDNQTIELTDDPAKFDTLLTVAKVLEQSYDL